MERRAFETPLGEIWLWGEWGDESKPLVLAIHGAFALEKLPLQEMQRFIPQAQLIWTHLPGNHCPELSETSVEAFARALECALPNRPTLIVGESVGALVALMIRSPQVQRRLLIDPPFRTDHPALGGRLTGMFPTDDYRFLLDRIDSPTWVMVGGNEGLRTGRLPSLVGPEERNRLAQHPLVKFVLVRDAGHNVVAAAVMTVVRATQLLVEQLDNDLHKDSDQPPVSARA